MSQEKISKLVFSYMGTTLVALTFNSLYTLVDSLFVSWGIGDNAMGGVSLVLPFVMLQSAISTALGGGAASIISRRIGQKDLKYAGNIAIHAMVTFWVTAIMVTIVGFIMMQPLLQGLGVTDQLYDYAKGYFTIILAGNVFSTGFSSIIRSEGKMRYALMIWVIPICVNIVLDALFILVLGWGVEGSAYATVACQFTSFVMSIYFFTKKSTLVYEQVRIRFKTVISIVSMGMPALIQSLVISLTVVLVNNLLRATGGTLAINTYAYVNRIIMYAVIPFVALMQAISPIIGFNYGSGNRLRIKETVRFSLILSYTYAFVVMALLMIFARYGMMIFTKDDMIINEGIRAIRILAVSLPLTPLAMTFGTLYQAEGLKWRAMLMYGMHFIWMMPLIGVGSYVFGLSGVWWGYVLAYGVTTFIVGVFSWIKAKRRNI